MTEKIVIKKRDRISEMTRPVTVVIYPEQKTFLETYARKNKLAVSEILRALINNFYQQEIDGKTELNKK